MKRTHVLIAVLALMSMTAAAQVAHAQEWEQGSSLRVVASQAMSPTIGDRAHSKQTRRMALGKC